MTTLILGASGTTGRHLVDQLLNVEEKVKIIVRSLEKLPESWKTNDLVTIIQASVSDITLDEMTDYIQGCHAVASCLGHNIDLKGIFGKPRKLVSNAVSLVCKAIEKNAKDKPVKVVLMNTTGNRNRDLNELISTGEKIVIGLLRVLLPPHVDNEKTADYLRTEVGQKNNFIEWVAVRPDPFLNSKSLRPTEGFLFLIIVHKPISYF